jgi:RNA polymerase sigma factor (sigma-70 family)
MESVDRDADDTPELSARLVKGEEAAWREFHARTFDRLLRYLRTVAHGNEEAAHEALQRAYVKSVRHVRRFETERVMWGWLAQIARGCLIDLARREQRYATLLGRLAAEPPQEHSAQAGGAELRDLLSASLTRLTASDRALIEAHYMDGQRIQQIATSIGTTPKAIESRLARIRNRLRTWLSFTNRNEC